MCHVIDDAWEVYASWWGIGQCSDCGRTARVLYEETGPADFQELRAAEEFVYGLMLNDGVPDLSRSIDDLIDDGPADFYELIYFAKPEIESTILTCEHCLEARRWLEEWCHSWMYGDYRSDVIGHWSEIEVGRHLPLGRLVVLADRNWRASRTTVGKWSDPQPLVPVETVRTLVDESLAWLRATTGRQFAA